MGPGCDRPTTTGGVRLSVRHRYDLYPRHTGILYATDSFGGTRRYKEHQHRRRTAYMYATDMGLSVAYRPLVRLRCDAPKNPNPPYQYSMACVLSVRHGYGHSRGVHFSGTPPLRSCGVQDFVYASDEHSSYDLFPSSDLAIVVLDPTLTRTSCRGCRHYASGGLRPERYPSP
jgi:hypothetical protein